MKWRTKGGGEVEICLLDNRNLEEASRCITHKIQVFQGQLRRLQKIREEVDRELKKRKS